MRVMERIRPGTRVAGPENISLPEGYTIEPVAEGLNYPTSVSWDADGCLLIAESRFPYGKSAQVEPRILRLQQGGAFESMISGFSDLITDITVHNGLLYVSHRGKISLVEDGRVRDLITGLPSWGMHHNNAIVFDREGHLYFGQGTVTNAGVIGPMSLELLRKTQHADLHDTPGADVILTGKNYPVTDSAINETKQTGAFSSWGTITPAGHRIPGAAPGQAASGAIMRANADGTDLRVYAWGFRNPFGLAFSADGRLYATNNGANMMAPRKIANDPDTLWEVEEGVWYGWPDYYVGKPVTDTVFRPAEAPPHEFLIANHDELLKGRSGPPQPIVSFGVNVSADKFDFCFHPEFGYENQAFVAEFGPMLALLDGGSTDSSVGRKVVRVDLEKHLVSDLAVNADGSYPSANGNQGGLERPVEAKFGPDGCLYIVDYGVTEQVEGVWEATEGTGIVWKVAHTG